MGYICDLGIYYCAIKKDVGKRLPQMYYVKMKICYDPYLSLEFPWLCYDAIMYLLAFVFPVTLPKKVNGSFMLPWQL